MFLNTFKYYKCNQKVNDKFLILVIIFFSFFSADAQDVSELDRRNGFKDIKMASLVTSYEGLEYHKNIDDEVFPQASQYKAKKGHYESIGSVKIHDLIVKTYQDSIFEITVVVDMDPNLYKGLKKAFGEPEYAYRSGVYRWSAENLSLSWSAHSKNKIQMVYYSREMKKKLKKDKEEVVEEIVDDF